MIYLIYVINGVFFCLLSTETASCYEDYCFSKKYPLEKYFDFSTRKYNISDDEMKAFDASMRRNPIWILLSIRDGILNAIFGVFKFIFNILEIVCLPFESIYNNETLQDLEKMQPGYKPPHRPSSWLTECRPMKLDSIPQDLLPRE